MSLMVSIQIKQKIAESRLGAVVTLAHLTKDGWIVRPSGIVFAGQEQWDPS